LNSKSLKKRVLLWFGGVTAVLLIVFSIVFNYFLNQSINNNILIQLKAVANHLPSTQIPQNIGIAVVHNNEIVNKNSAFRLNDFRKYLKSNENFFIIQHNKDDDFIDALYIKKSTDNQKIIVYKTNINNKIENFQDVLLFLIPILLAVLILLASKMTDKILQPIHNLIQTTKNISINNFSKKIEVPQEDDEIKELIISFNEMIQRLRNGVTMLDRFNSDVSHELKTPLTVIQGEIEITLKKVREPLEYQKSMRTVFEQSKQIQNIIEQLLLLTKYSKENIKKSFEECSLDSILLNAVDKYETQLHTKNIKLHIQKLDPVRLEANPMLISSIFSNLIDNAIKYSANDTNIYISLIKSSKIVFSIRDEGIGVDPQQLDKITQRFYRADISRNKKIKGFGLGLSIVKNSVELHNATMKIESKPKKGTVVEILF
jgi:signal transduction histidine kinase